MISKRLEYRGKSEENSEEISSVALLSPACFNTFLFSSVALTYVFNRARVAMTNVLSRETDALKSSSIKTITKNYRM